MMEVLRAGLPQTNGCRDMPGGRIGGRACSAITVQVRAAGGDFPSDIGMSSISTPDEV